MPQFFVNKRMDPGQPIEIRGKDAHHISNVLRLKAGDWLVLSDGEGRSFRAKITHSRGKSIIADIESEIPHRKGPLPPALAIAMIKSDRLEWAIQKSVELGCRHIIPFNSSRTLRKSLISEDSRLLTRLRRIAVEAAKQSGLPVMPAVDVPWEFDELCAHLSNFASSILLYEGEHKNDLSSILKGEKARINGSASQERLIIIGPEGGFTACEVDLALSRGAITASLGTQILRVETAALAAMAICQYELGNMDVS
jgi:16S rRNA (uracil1498-N3)-methyltransferase